MSGDEEAVCQLDAGGAAADGQPLRDRTDLVSSLHSFIVKNPHIFGGADIFAIDFLSPQERAGTLAGVLTGLIDADHRPTVREFVIIVPPGLDVQKGEAEAWNEMLATFRLLAGRELTLQEQSWFRARFRMIAAPDRRSRSLLNLIEAQAGTDCCDRC